MRVTASEFKAAISLLEKFRTDFQFDKKDPGYLGFLNVGSHILEESEIPVWQLICNRAQVFTPILHELGLEIEGDRLDPEETVFLLADC